MFYYLGRKKALAGKYPRPLCDTIIEPFAGSAAYSLHENYWQKDVIINDLNPVTIGIWKYLQEATTKDIEQLPDLEPGDRLSEIESLTEIERWLISFHINPAASQSSRRDQCTKFSRWPTGKKYIANNLHKIKHWTVIEGSYEDLPDIEASWFVDPPYQEVGKDYYACGDVDYDHLGTWCEERKGQMIVCEMEGADWLPFEPLVEIAICGKKTSSEVWYYNLDDHISPYRGSILEPWITEDRDDK